MISAMSAGVATTPTAEGATPTVTPPARSAGNDTPTVTPPARSAGVVTPTVTLPARPSLWTLRTPAFPEAGATARFPFP